MGNAPVIFPREGQGFRAEIRIGDDIHLVLLAVHTAVGPMATVFDVKIKKWWQREWAEDIDNAKQKAEGLARRWYGHVGRREEFPVVAWQETG